MEIRIELPEDVRMIIDRFRSHGYSADVVGGAVRDALLHRPVGDYDITTDCLPNEVKELFPEYQIFDTGIKHGTVTLLVGRVPYEITTYRIDGEYTDKRHPTEVVFSSSLREDTARRDFTVNAMCYNQYDGLRDFHGGVSDLSSRVIRTVGEPCRRFDEDALRILRALRFSSVLGFGIDAATQDAIRAKKDNLRGVSSERIYAEWIKLLGGVGAWEVLDSFADVVRVFIPELFYLKLPRRELFSQASAQTRLFSLFYLNCSESSRDFEAAMRRLKTDGAIRNEGVKLLDAYNRVDFSSTEETLFSMYRFGEECVYDALQLGRLLGRFNEKEQDILRAAVDCGRAYKISMLCINGRDVAEMGYKGEKIGAVLDFALREVIFGRVENECNSLLALCRNFDSGI